MPLHSTLQRLIARNERDTVRVGMSGEAVAERHLRMQRYRIIGRNVRVGAHDEIDIIAFDPVDRVLVFAEVKSRARKHPDYTPDLNMTWRKRRSVSRAARTWIAERNYDGGYRLDLLCVADNAVTEHYRDIEWD